jgi:hypothetical protein
MVTRLALAHGHLRGKKIMKALGLGLIAALLLTAGGAFAEEAKSTNATTAKPTTKVERSEKSKKCSADADAKKLHGKARKEFRKACMKAA